MIEYTKSSIFDCDVQVIVNPVNCVGIMGRGLAWQFKQKFPAYFNDYRDKCVAGEIKIGSIDCYLGTYPKYLISFPTKIHWRNPSQLSYIERGLVSLAQWVSDTKIESIALPALGCGLGGLAFEDVKKEIEKTFKDFENVKVMVCAR